MASQHQPGACTERRPTALARRPHTKRGAPTQVQADARSAASRSPRSSSRSAVRRRGRARRWRPSGGRTADSENDTASCQAATPPLCFSFAFWLSLSGCRACHRRRLVDGVGRCLFGAAAAGAAPVLSPLLLSRVPLLVPSHLTVFSTSSPRPLFYTPRCRCAACQWQRPPHHELPVGCPQLHCRQ